MSDLPTQQQPQQPQPAAGTVPAAAAATPSAPAAAVAGATAPQQPKVEAAQPRMNQSAVNAYDKLLQDKERTIRESIAKKFSKIHEVERQLGDLQTALHVNVGPRRQALEHLRNKIEEQNHTIDFHRAAFKKAKAAMDEAQKHLDVAEAEKEQLAQELNMLVQESANSQLKKLEELTLQLDHLTGEGPTQHVAAANGSGGGMAAGGGQTGGGGDAAVSVQSPASLDDERQQQAGGADREAGSQQAQQQAEQRRQQQVQRQAAADARGRHVQIGRKASSGGARPATRIPTPSAESPSSARAAAVSQTRGPFQGFE